jgi:hypothetical protein
VAGFRVKIRIEGANEVIRALDRLPEQARRALKDEAFDIADYLADKIKIAAQGDSRQSARAASSVKAVKGGTFPTIQAGGTKRADGVLYGSEFGASRRFGWYSLARYARSEKRQFRPHRGASSYWFFKTAEREQSWVANEWNKAAERVVREWGA